MVLCEVCFVGTREGLTASDLTEARKPAEKDTARRLVNYLHTARSADAVMPLSLFGLFLHYTVCLELYVTWQTV